MKKDAKVKITSQALDSGRLLFLLGLFALLLYALLRIDLLAIVSACSLGIYFATYLISRSSLSGMRMEISTSQSRARAREPVSVKITIFNQNRILPVFYPTISIRQEDTLHTQVFQFRAAISPRSKTEIGVSPSFEKRGVHRLEAFAARSQFPFALHQSISSTSSRSQQIIVWPTTLPVDLESIFHEPPRSLFETSGENAINLRSTEASRIRDYQTGDPKSRINWKLSAKRDQLTVIDPRNQQLHKYELHLDTSIACWKSEFVFNRMISLVSTLVSELSIRKLLQGISIDEIHYPMLTNKQTTRFYDALAQLTPSSHKSDSNLGAGFTKPYQRRHQHLWILPAPNANIVLSSSHEDKIQVSQL